MLKMLIRCATCSLVAFMLISFILIPVFLTLILRKPENSSDNPEVYSYQYYEFNPSLNKSTVGFVSSFEHFKVDEFDSYENRDGNHVLISNFGSTEYHCTLICSCEKSEERRSTASIIQRSFLYLVGAASSMIAYNIAVKHFKEDQQCEEIMKEESCSISSIKSDLSCEEREKLRNKLRKARNTYYDDEFAEKYAEYHPYFCKGNCMPKLYNTDEENLMVEQFECHKLELESEIEVDISGVLPRMLETYAESIFRKEHMVRFCKKNGHKKYFYTSPHGQKFERIILLCMGSAGGTNPSVKCKASSSIASS